MRVVAAVPRLYLGTMTFGWHQASSRVDEGVASAMLDAFATHHRQHHHTGRGDGDDPCRIDTARIYAGGATEAILGAALSSDNTALSVGTKAHPSQPGGLSPAGLRSQLAASLAALGGGGRPRDGVVGEFYLHQPDPAHSLLDSLRCAHELVQEGTITTVGLSNYHAAETARAFTLCEEHGLTKPTVYQGLYNPLNRLVEDELLPLLQEHGCSFVAYNPLAAGLLAGKHRVDGGDDAVLPGRFRENPNYLPRFYTPANFRALALLRAACDAADLTLLDATYVWMLRHSALTTNDGLLLGASSTDQLAQNLDACTKATTNAELPAMVLQAFEEAWEITRAHDPFPYWRSYSADMPGRDALDPGAAYSATKKE